MTTSSSFMVLPLPPTGNNRRIELAGMDLIFWVCINNVFVYPGEINIDRLQEALSRTLSLWPLVAGRTILENDQHYFIEMCDNPIPIAVVANNELKEWPLDSNVVVELDNKLLPTFIDLVDVTKLFINSPDDEPLLRLKLTHIVESNEWVLGLSWYHPLGEADSCLRFSNTLSRFYQQLEPLPPAPIFERRIWREDEVKQTILRIPEQYRNPQPKEVTLEISSDHQLNYHPINLHFTGEQLATLRALAGGNTVTTQDALTAYIILTLNTHCYHDQDDLRMLHTVTVTNLRGISDSIVPQGSVSNALYMMVSDDFDDPYSLTSIAKTIRRSIIQLRNPEVLEPAIATVDHLLRKNLKDNKCTNPRLVPNEFAVNSNFRYDLAGLVDFGYTDKCRFYTLWSGALYLRVFRLNPEKHGNEWLPRDRDGAEISFRIQKELKENFLHAWKRDVTENFQNIKA